MARINIQDRTPEFSAILQQATKQHATKKLSAQRQSLLSSSEKEAANGAPSAKQRSEFARQAAQIGRGISSTMGKLEKLAQLAGRKALFDDRPAEINQLTLIIKQDLAHLDQDIRQLQTFSNKAHPPARGNADQQGEHNKNVLFLLRGKLGEVTTNFKSTLETRTKNIASSRARQDNFLTSVSASNPASINPSRTDSPLYQTEQQRQGQGNPLFQTTQAGQMDLLSLDMPTGGSSALTRNAPASHQQLMLMEEVCISSRRT
jgi:syntaxin 5